MHRHLLWVLQALFGVSPMHETQQQFQLYRTWMVIYEDLLDLEDVSEEVRQVLLSTAKASSLSLEFLSIFLGGM